jgi:hypothetical protein
MMSKMTFIKAPPLFTAKQVKDCTRNATLVQKLRLLVRPSKYTFDGNSVMRYKQMDGITFIMKSGTHIVPEEKL